jgi:16S rRNA (adenine1518-N6/adenine1519-N6)-dimethyltransferase
MTVPEIPRASELKELCADYGIRPTPRRGQNFMVDPATMEFLIDAGNVTAQDLVLEVGPGPGGLTGLLASRARHVVAVEIDNGLHELVTDRLGNIPNLEILHADAMAKGDRVNPAAMEAVCRAMGEGEREFKVVANLPYSISTALISALLTGDPVPTDIVVTVQKEVADRICSEPGCKEYGFLSVIVQAVADVKRLRILRPNIFWPQPEVDSAVLRITPSSERRIKVGDVAHLRRVASGIFTFRRKQLARALVMAGFMAGRGEAEICLGNVGISPMVRPEDLPLDKMIALAKTLS